MDDLNALEHQLLRLDEIVTKEIAETYEYTKSIRQILEYRIKAMERNRTHELRKATEMLSFVSCFLSFVVLIMILEMVF